jgi:hypothetical protein
VTGSSPFRDRGHRCLVVDFSERQLPGITRIATEIDNVEDEFKADVMICSHVLEHLASPLETMSKLQHHLAPDGILYSEVPDQVWLGIRIEEDPVTHINFFTEASFLELHRRAGFEIVEHTKRPGTYGAQQTPVIVVLARPLAAVGASAPESLESDTDRLLHPGRLCSLGHIIRYYVWAGACEPASGSLTAIPRRRGGRQLASAPS